MSRLKALLRNSSIYFGLELNPLRWGLLSAQCREYNSVTNYVLLGPVSLDIYLDWGDDDAQIVRLPFYLAP